MFVRNSVHSIHTRNGYLVRFVTFADPCTTQFSCTIIKLSVDTSTTSVVEPLTSPIAKSDTTEDIFDDLTIPMASQLSPTSAPPLRRSTRTRRQPDWWVPALMHSQVFCQTLVCLVYSVFHYWSGCPFPHYPQVTSPCCI